MPITRSSRWHSRTSASPNTCVYCGGAGLAPLGLAAAGAGMRLAIDFGFAACHFSIPSRPPSSAGAKPLPLTVATWTPPGRPASSAWGSRACIGALGLARRGQRGARRADLLADDDAHIGPVDPLPQHGRRGERLDRLLELR